MSRFRQAPYLKQRGTGAVFPYDPYLAKRPDMEPTTEAPKVRQLSLAERYRMPAQATMPEDMRQEFQPFEPETANTSAESEDNAEDNAEGEPDLFTGVVETTASTVSEDRDEPDAMANPVNAPNPHRRGRRSRNQ